MKTLVYISTPLNPDKMPAKLIDTYITTGPTDNFYFWPSIRPTDDRDRKTAPSCARVDSHHIRLCDEVWVFGPIGRDCAWEIGYAAGLHKIIKIYITKDNEFILDDWMYLEHSQIIDLRDNASEDKRDTELAEDHKWDFLKLHDPLKYFPKKH